jgi:hypothetical protein
VILPKLVAAAVLLATGWVIVQFPGIWVALAYLVPLLTVALFAYGLYKLFKGD